MPRATKRADAPRPQHGPMIQRTFHERRAIMATALDAALHAMSLAYIAKTPTERVTLTNEAIMWSNLAIANALEGLAAQRAESVGR